MKQQFTLILGMILTLAFSGKAQTLPKALSLGPMIGYGHTGITKIEGLDAKFKSSIAAGITATYSKNPHWGIGMDLLYSMEGGHFKGNGVDAKITLHYIRVPIKIGYYFRDVSDRLRPKITLGPSLGFLLKGEDEYKTSMGTVRNTGSYESFDIGIYLSAGFNYKLTENIWLNTELGYYYGFVDIAGNENDKANHNNNLGLKIGIAYGL